jgi:MFS family permease
MMLILDRLLDRIGDANPQIFRELKERLTLRNIGISVVATLIIQGFVLLYFNSQIPVPIPEVYPNTLTKASSPNNQGFQTTYSKYCQFSTDDYRSTDICKVDAANSFKINWQAWRSDIFICLSWILGMGSILGSVYTLVADLVREEKRGTLNFIRLSPQSAQKIAIGKILGVPVLVYLAAAMMLPLHLYFGFAAGATLPLLASWYAAIGAMWLLLSSASVLYVLLGGVQAIVTAIAVGFPLYVPIFAVNKFLSGTIDHNKWLTNSNHYSWFGLAIFNNAIWLNVWMTGCCLVASYWVWQALERRYLNPAVTAISKSQSYLVNLCFQILMAGFVIPLIPQSFWDKQNGIASFAVMDFTVLLLLIPLLLPGKQVLQDWSRHRRERLNQPHRKFWQRELIQDLIGNDKSPALLAIGINIGMAIVWWIPIATIAFNSYPETPKMIEVLTPSHGIRFLAGICLAASLILIYAAIAHLSLFLNVKKRNLWTIAIVSATAILPIIGAFVLSPFHNPTGFAAILLLFSPLAPAGILHLAGGSILATFAAQLVMLATLTRQLQRKLQISGQSQTKELLARG